MRHLTLCVLALCGGCGEKTPAQRVIPGYDPVPDQSDWLLHRIAEGPAVEADIFLRVEQGGRLTIREQGRWRGATLDELGAHLVHAKRAFAGRQRALGRRSHEVDGSGMERGASRQVVEVDLHPETPWLHLYWLICICMEERFDKLLIRVGGRTFYLFLPWDAAIEYTEPPPHIHATVRYQGDDRYRTDAGEDKNLAGVVRYLASRRQAAEQAGKADVLVGVPTMPRTMPAERVLDLFGAFLESGIPRLDLPGHALPSREARQLEVLPPIR